MKIKSNKYKNQSLRFFKKVVEFDANGEAEVSKELGAQIEEKYSDILNTVEKAEKVEEIKTDEGLKQALKDSEANNKILNERLTAAKDDCKKFEADAANWKEEFQKAKDSGGGDATAKITKKDIELILDLSKESKGKLEETATALKLPKKEWDILKKDDLVIYLAIKAINAKS